MQLESIQKLLPTADVVAGSVIVYHDMKHYDLGKYVGEGSVILTPEAEALLVSLEAKQEPKRKRKPKSQTEASDGESETTEDETETPETPE